MRVLIATHASFPHVGGLSTYMSILRDQLHRSSVGADIIASTADMDHYYMPSEDRYVERTQIGRRIRSRPSAYLDETTLSPDPAVMECEIQRHIFERSLAAFGLDDYDIIHAQDWLCARAIEAVKAPHVPLIATLHGLAPKRVSYDYLQESTAILACDRVIVPSMWMKEYYVSTYGIDEHHFTVIPHGIESACVRASDDRGADERSAAKAVLVCTARLSPEKGHAHLLRSLRRLKDVRGDWECWLAGDGESRVSLEQQCHDLELNGHVRFLGDRSDVGDLLHQADIFVLASSEDNCPFAVIEAQMSGTPVVASAAGGIPELVCHGLTGLLSPVGDSEAMSRNVLRLLDDRALRARLAANGRRWARHRFSVDRMLQETLTLYARVSDRSVRPIQPSRDMGGL